MTNMPTICGGHAPLSLPGCDYVQTLFIFDKRKKL